jgi:hypothetical protein
MKRWGRDDCSRVYPTSTQNNHIGARFDISAIGNAVADAYGWTDAYIQLAGMWQNEDSFVVTLVAGDNDHITDEGYVMHNTVVTGSIVWEYNHNVATNIKSYATANTSSDYVFMDFTSDWPTGLGPQTEWTPVLTPYVFACGRHGNQVAVLTANTFEQADNDWRDYVLYLFDAAGDSLTKDGHIYLGPGSSGQYTANHPIFEEPDACWEAVETEAGPYPSVAFHTPTLCLFENSLIISPDGWHFYDVQLDYDPVTELPCEPINVSMDSSYNIYVRCRRDHAVGDPATLYSGKDRYRMEKYSWPAIDTAPTIDLTVGGSSYTGIDDWGVDGVLSGFGYDSATNTLILTNAQKHKCHIVRLNPTDLSIMNHEIITEDLPDPPPILPIYKWQLPDQVAYDESAGMYLYAIGSGRWFYTVNALFPPDDGGTGLEPNGPTVHWGYRVRDMSGYIHTNNGRTYVWALLEDGDNIEAINSEEIELHIGVLEINWAGPDVEPQYIFNAEGTLSGLIPGASSSASGFHRFLKIASYGNKMYILGRDVVEDELDPDDWTMWLYEFTIGEAPGYNIGYVRSVNLCTLEGTEPWIKPQKVYIHSFW